MKYLSNFLPRPIIAKVSDRRFSLDILPSASTREIVSLDLPARGPFLRSLQSALFEQTHWT